MSDRRETIFDFLKVFGLVVLAFIGGLAARTFMDGFNRGYEAARAEHAADESTESTAADDDSN